MPAILFGSISTLADTSELQRHAFNDAFAAHGLDWRWDREDYLALLERSGGRDRIAAHAAQRGEEVDADEVHRTKSRLFQEGLVDGDVHARPGVVDTIRRARERGWKVALVTTTSPENVRALLAALGSEIDRGGFDVVVDSSQVEDPKPSPEAYELALRQLGLRADQCVAVEDNLGGVASALAAGLACVAFPNANTAAHNFSSAAMAVDEVDLDRLDELVA